MSRSIDDGLQEVSKREDLPRAYYGRVGGALITGNEDGAKHCAMNMLYATSRLCHPAASRCGLAR
jgi:hypothetical protein